MEGRIEAGFVRLLGAGEGVVVMCGVVEAMGFGDGTGDEEGRGEATGKGEEMEEAGEVDEELSDDGGVDLPRSPPLPALKITGNETRTDETDSRRAGLQRAHYREKVRQAARRGCAFGFLVGDDIKTAGEDEAGQVAGEKKGKVVKGEGRRMRKVEAVQGSRVVEASFAKGEFGVRWVD